MRPSPNPMVRTLDAFVADTQERDAADEPFAMESPRTLRIDVDGGVWLRPGAAIAYRGDLRFERLPTLGAASARDAVLREAAPLVRARGRGRLYCAAHGAHLHVVRLAGEAVVVAWRDLVAIQESLKFESALVGGGIGLAAGGLVATTLSGHGVFAVATHGQPLALVVTPDRPVCTDPHATVAWSASLAPSLKSDIGWRSAIGHGGQEPFQMLFAGTGYVVVQPSQDPGRFGLTANPLKQAAKLLKL